MIYTILLSYLTWFWLLLLCKQNKYLNFFELIWFWFWVWISLFVFELLIQNIVFWVINLIFPILSFVIVFSILLYLLYKWDIKLEFNFIINNKNTYKNFVLWKKILVFLFIFISFWKIWLSLATNLSHPTLWEDAVTWWDLKTKVFFENRSIPLDKNNSENLWWEQKRTVSAPLTDVYFILPYKSIPIWWLNIFSWLVYLNMTILLFGIFLRKFDLFIAALASYLWVSLPIVFIQSIDGYFNLSSWFFLFTFTYYLSDQIIKNELKNLYILIPLWILVFLDSSIRSESLLLVSVILIFDLFILFVNKKISKSNIYMFIPIFLWIVLSWSINKYCHSFSSFDKILTDWFDILSLNWFKQLIENVFNWGLFWAVFSQALFHPDYILLYLLFILSLIYLLFNKKLFFELNIYLYKAFILLWIFLTILFMIPEFWLLTHFAFLRYSLPITPFILYICIYTIWYIFKEQK